MGNNTQRLAKKGKASNQEGSVSRYQNNAITPGTRSEVKHLIKADTPSSAPMMTTEKQVQAGDPYDPPLHCAGNQESSGAEVKRNPSEETRVLKQEEKRLKIPQSATKEESDR